MTNTPFKQYYRVDEVAEYFAISVRTVYRLIDEGGAFSCKDPRLPPNPYMGD